MSLANSQVTFLKSLGEYLAIKGIKSFLVGGCVRDLLMQVEVKDLDVMLEGDAGDVLTELYKKQDFSYRCSKPIIFKKYKTAKVVFSKAEENFTIDLDFSSARKEVYPEIAANPICQPATYLEDLARRDFSINALALSLLDLDQPIDLFHGLADLSHKLIRVLHPLSFRDDPVRLLRAARFISRFGFAFEPETERLFYEAIDNKYATFLSERRVNDELKKALAEDCWEAIFSYLSEQQLLVQFSPLISEAWGKEINKSKIECILSSKSF